MENVISHSGSSERKYELEPEDNILAFAQARRKEIVNELMKGGVPYDPDNVRVVLSALKDMDSQAINRRRIKVEEKHNDLQAQGAALIAKVLSSSNAGLYTAVVEGSARVIPVLPSTVAAPVLVEGEIEDITINQHTFESFSAKFSPDEE